MTILLKSLSSCDGFNQSEVMSFENSDKQKQNNFLLAITEY